jgi:hypothetical protein
MKKPNNRQLKILQEKCLNLVKQKSFDFFNFRKMKGCVGLCNWSDLELDYRKDVLPTAYHECLHYLYPDYSETYVRYLESRIINKCDVLDHSYFLKILSNKIYKSELQKHILKKRKNKKVKK